MSTLLDYLVGAIHPDRDTLAAFHRGVAGILFAVAGTLTVVGVLMAACGCGLWCAAVGLPLLPPAAVVAWWARMLGTLR